MLSDANEWLIRGITCDSIAYKPTCKFIQLEWDEPLVFMQLDVELKTH